MAADNPTSSGLMAQLGTMRRYYQAEPVPTLARRMDWLDSLATLLKHHQLDIAEAINADFGHRSSVETRLAEVFPALEGVRHARRHLRGWMRPQRRSVSVWFMPARARVLPQPLGVVGIVVPWNYPLFLAIGPLVAALAAGNRVLLKMSELTPKTGALLAQLLQRYLGDDVVQVVNGDVAVARAFAALPFDHLLFTGSTRVGYEVMRSAAANLVPVTLELGGKSPVLLAPDADIAHAARRIVAGKMLNAGQTCVAPDYVLVHEDRRDALLAGLRKAVLAAYPSLAGNADCSAIVNAAHYQRLCQWRDEAAAAGAQIDEVKPAAESADALHAVRKLPLTLILNAPSDCTLMREEIFGPLLPVVTYRDFADAIAYINARARPLALYLFDRDKVRVAQTLAATLSGGVTVNDILLHVAQDDLPFGGVGASGMGHYHAHEGFLTFSKLRPVLYQSRLAGTWLTAPPYGKVIAHLLRLMIGR